MTNTTNIIHTTTRAASLFAMSFIAATAAFGTIEVADPGQAQARSNSIEKNKRVSTTSQRVRLPGGTTTKIKAPRKPRKPRSIKTGVRQLKGKSMGSVRVHRNSGPKLKGNAFTKGTKIHLAPGASRHLPHELGHVVDQAKGRARPSSIKSFKSTKSLSSAGRTARTAKNAKAANNARKAAKALKAAKAAKLAVAGTGVGAAVSIGASMAGLDPVEMATLKATNPAEYNRRMRDLKKNPVKYVGKNVANNTKKAAKNVGKAGKKVGCGIGNAFKKKGKRKKC